MNKDVFIFVYGTLKKGFPNNWVIIDLEYIADAFTCEKYQMYPSLNYSFPYLIKSEKNYYIKGEVYKLNSKYDLNALDEIEGYPSLFTREKIKIKILNGDILEAIIYFKNKDQYKDDIKLDEPITEWI